MIGALEEYVRKNYGKELYFKVRKREAGEQATPIYVSDEELKNAVHMEIELED